MTETIFSQSEVNTGRQREFDYLKGSFMLLIYLVHAFQATLSPEDGLTRWIYLSATMSGAAIFIFVMGIGTVYGRSAAPAEFARSGVRMVICQYLNNLAYVAALLLPYPLVSGTLSETGRENVRFLTGAYIQYTNIFFITGIIYFVLALLRKWKVKTAGYAVIGVLFAVAAPFLYGIPVDVPVLGYLTKLLIGDAVFVSFTPLYFLSYALLGVVFGRILRHVADKVRFYRRLAVPCAGIVAVWWILVFWKYGSDPAEMFAVLSDAYTHPDLWHVIASLAHILLSAAIVFFVERACGAENGPKNPAAVQLLYYSRHISEYYAVHVPVYLVALGFHGYENFQGYQCWLLALLSIVVTELVVRASDALSRRRKKTVY